MFTSRCSRFVLVAALLCLASAVAFAATLHVSPGGSIQAAIDSASNGDVVVVAAGTYHECINFSGKAITVTSTDPGNPSVVAATIINGGKGGSVVFFNANETAASVLAGFTITNGSGTTGAGQAHGGGIYIVNSSPIIRNNVITGNSVTWDGGGIFCDASTSCIQDNTIRGNAATGTFGSGSGIFLAGGAPVVRHNLISGNSAAHSGGGIACSSSAVIENNTITDNTAKSGGGLSVEWGSPTIRNSIIAFSKGGGGLNVSTADPFVFAYCDVYGNTGGDYANASLTGKSGNISKDPLFVDAANGKFRLKSAAGRWNGTAWVKDTTSSPCLDAGDPTSAFNLEPLPNGGCINMGFDGGTIYASKGVPPKLVSATGVDATHVDLLFSKGLGPVTSQTATNYKVAPTLEISAAVRQADLKTVRLTTASQTDAKTYTVTVSGVKDLGGTVIVAGSGDSKSWTVDLPPKIKSVTYVNATHVDVLFSKAVGPVTSQTAGNYKVSPARTVSAAERQADLKTVRLTLTAQTSGVTYKLTVSGVKSASGVLIVAGSGDTKTWKAGAASPSVVVLAAVAAPTSVGAQITVNLTAAAEVTVTIRNLAGREIAVLTPGQLDAGVHSLLWNGTSTSGTKAPAGTYLVQVGAQGAEGATASALATLRR